MKERRLLWVRGIRKKPGEFIKGLSNVRNCDYYNNITAS